MKWTKYALKMKDHFDSIYAHPGATKMCLGKEPTDIYKIELEECENGQYWAYQDKGKDDINMIHPHVKAFGICFPYGLESELKRDRGRVVRLKVVSESVEIKGATY